MKQVDEDKAWELIERFVEAVEKIADGLHAGGGTDMRPLEKIAVELEGAKHAFADIATSLTQISDSIDTLAPDADDDE